MNCPKLIDLPSPECVGTGWPWTEEPIRDSKAHSNINIWPKISIVTPSYNQGSYIEETIRSILLQGYPNIEYIIIDGGSTDGSLRIIDKYRKWLHYFVSEKDRGQTDALNKGFERATGDICAYLNSDDVYLPNLLFDVAAAFINSKKSWLAATVYYGSLYNIRKVKRFSFPETVCGLAWQQPGVFWRREAATKPYFSLKYSFVFDREFFIRLYSNWGMPYLLTRPAAFFRIHPDSKTTRLVDTWEKESLALIQDSCLKVTKAEAKRIQTVFQRRIFYLEARKLFVDGPKDIFGKIKTFGKVLALTITRSISLCDFGIPVIIVWMLFDIIRSKLSKGVFRDEKK